MLSNIGIPGLIIVLIIIGIPILAIYLLVRYLVRKSKSDQEFQKELFTKVEFIEKQIKK